MHELSCEYPVANQVSGAKPARTPRAVGVILALWLIFAASAAVQAQSCTYRLGHTGLVFLAGGGGDTVTVTAEEGCVWTATSNAPWITLNSSNPRTGSGSVSYSVPFNAGPDRTGTLTIAGETFTVTQLACYFSLGSATAEFSAAGGSGSVSVFSEEGCTWSAASNASWIVITGGADGSKASVQYSVLPNAGAPRTGTITVANLTHTVTQASSAALSLSVTNTNDSGPGSLRQALLDANANVGHANTIGFAIPGPSTIAPLTPLPAITNRLSINGINSNGARVVLSGAASSGYFYLYLRAADSAIRGLAVSESDYGIYVEGDRTVIENCLIGTDAAGAAPRANEGNGIGVCANDVRIGGTGTTSGNVVGASGYAGVALLCGTRNVVQNNFIGTNAAGADLGNKFVAVHLESSGNTVGGAGNGTGNTIAFNRRQGVIALPGTANALRRNSIHSNAGLGIDLDADGVTPNDAWDSDSGPNGLQNFPVLASAYQGSTIVQGTFHSSPMTSFVLEFFSSAVCDSSGHGEGRTFLGQAEVTTDANGNAPLSVSFAATTPKGHSITATATGPGGTSEFSGCRVVGDPPPIITSFSPSSGLPGATLRISGQNFAGANGVLINGAAASFSLQSANLITAVVPANASSGPITVLSQHGSGSSTSNFTVLADSDADGMPDEFEHEHFGHPTSGNPAADSDGDGMANAAEYRAGTSPTSAASALRILTTTRNANGTVTLTFASVAGKFYRLECRENIAGADWQPLQANISGTGSPVQVIDSTASDKLRRFYRVVVIP